MIMGIDAGGKRINMKYFVSYIGVKDGDIVAGNVGVILLKGFVSTIVEELTEEIKEQSGNDNITILNVVKLED